MNKHLSAVLAATPLLCLLQAPTADAAPAAPSVLSLSQPDGSRFEARRQGDEWCNYLVDSRGLAITRDAQQQWVYVQRYQGATPEPSRVRVGEVPQGIRPALRPLCASPDRALDPTASLQTLGSFTGHVLFLLASFENQAGTYTEAEFATFLEYDINAFYNTVSYGAVELLPAQESYGTVDNGVVGWLKLQGNHPNTGGNTGIRNQLVSKSAIETADPYVDYAAYDTNHDGYVGSDELAIVVILAGYEAAYGEYQPSVWGHQWDLTTVGAPTLDGVVVGALHENSGGYCQFGEIHQSDETDGHQATVGIMVHELGHLIFRLPDLYDVDGSSNGAGAWCYMSYGAWGYAFSDPWYGDRPVMPCGWVRMNMGWATPTPASGLVTVLAAAADGADPSNALFSVRTTKATEYFLLENRQPVGYDLGLEGTLETTFGGMAIWHIDSTQGGNSSDARRLTDIEESDGSRDGFAASNLWFEENPSSQAGFTNSSRPSSRLNNGRPSGVSITGFSATTEVMTANVTPGASAR